MQKEERSPLVRLRWYGGYDADQVTAEVSCTALFLDMAALALSAHRY